MASTSALQPSPAVLPPADFADWLSPMLVKELRQGVRTRMFVVVFILLQLAMLLDLSLSLLVAANGLDASEGTLFFWLVVSVPVLLIVPLSGLNAVGSEIKANTLELIFLTRLSAFRIVVGKWFALFVQSLLFVCAVLPYLVLRYFMGGVNIANELFALGSTLLLSAMLTALAVGASAFPARLVRPLATVGGLFFFFFGTEILFGGMRGSRFATTLPGAFDIGTALVWSALLTTLLLDVGAARIAPPAENHAGFMRALAFAGLLLAAGLSLLPGAGRGTALAVGPFAVAVAVCAVAVCEQPREIPSVYRPFARRGILGRLVGRFFYPGWPSGTLFTLAMFAGFAALFWRGRLFTHEVNVARFVAGLGTLLFPAALAHTVFRRFQRPVAVFLLTVSASLVALIFCSVCDGALGTHLRSAVSYLPPASLVASWLSYDGHGFNREWSVVMIITGLSALVVLGASVPVFRSLRSLERASLALPDPPRPGASTSPETTAPASYVPLA